MASLPQVDAVADAVSGKTAAQLIAKVKPGDKIKFQADIVGSKATVVDLRVVKN